MASDPPKLHLVLDRDTHVELLLNQIDGSIGQITTDISQEGNRTHDAVVDQGAAAAIVRHASTRSNQSTAHLTD